MPPDEGHAPSLSLWFTVGLKHRGEAEKNHFDTYLSPAAGVY